MAEREVGLVPVLQAFLALRTSHTAVVLPFLHAIALPGQLQRTGVCEEPLISANEASAHAAIAVR